MPHSILDLAGSNKLDKPYLAGAYGQGGSTAFGFTRGGTVVASSIDGRCVGVTFVRYLELDARTNKNGRYEYLVAPDGTVPQVKAASAAFSQGTLVRHFDYELPRHTGAIDEVDGGLLGVVAAALFDPVLPMTLVDRRTRRRSARQLIFGGSARTLARAEAPIVELRESFTIPLGRRGKSGVLAIHYWLLAGEDEAALRLRPDPRNAVTVTNFGQAHDAWSRSFVVDDLKMPFLKNTLVVQVELDRLTPGAKRELLSTTRDRLKRGDLFGTLREAVRDALTDDASLQRANTERRRRLLARQRAADQERLQRRFAELMERFQPGIVAGISSNGSKGSTTQSADSGESSMPAEPLPTLEHPTFLRFTHEGPLALPAGRTTRIALESDAPDAYLTGHALARLVVAGIPLDAVTFVRATDFRGGRARVSVRADAAIGTTGALAVRLTAADETVHACEAPFSIVEPPPVETADRDGRKGMRVPNVFEVMRDRWSEHGFDERSVASVGESRDDYSIFVNMDNVHFVRLIDGSAYQQTGLTRAKSTYLVQVALYAFLQHRSIALTAPFDPDQFEEYRRSELDRVAQLVVSSIGAADRLDGSLLPTDP